MNMKTIINIMKMASLAVTVVPPVVEGATIIAKGTTKFVKNKIDKSETINNIKRDFELRREGVVTVKYQEV